MAKNRKSRHILITGGSGLLGTHLIAHRPAWATLTATHNENPLLVPGASAFPLNLADVTAPAKMLKTLRPDAIIHAASIANPDVCERNPETARQVNVLGTMAIAKAASEAKTRLIYISTDLVFDGNAGPYAEDDCPNPIQVYGRTKLEAESAVRAFCPDSLIVRVTLLYGKFTGNEKGPINWMLDRVTRGEPIICFEDQIRSPLWLGDAAEAIYRAVDSPLQGCLHLGGPEALDRCEFARIIAESFGWPDKVLQNSLSTSHPLAAPRPANSSYRIDRLRRELDYEPKKAQDVLPSIVQSFSGRKTTNP